MSCRLLLRSRQAAPPCRLVGRLIDVDCRRRRSSPLPLDMKARLLFIGIDDRYYFLYFECYSYCFDDCYYHVEFILLKELREDVEKPSGALK